MRFPFISLATLCAALPPKAIEITKGVNYQIGRGRRSVMTLQRQSRTYPFGCRKRSPGRQYREYLKTEAAAIAAGRWA